MVMRHLLRHAALALLIVVALPLSARAQERILLFVRDVKVQQNGDLLVTETIRVLAEGREIRRGILRDFPTTYRRQDGARVVVGFEVRSVTRDGNDEPFITERMSNGVRIRIGNPNQFISNGQHTYVITYRTTRQIGFFQNYDELYWNATGTGWTFAIEVAEARITLPQNVPFRQSAFYTGPQDARDQDARVVEQRPGYIMFRTTRPLPARSGLTVAAGWDKGMIAPPTAAQRVGWLLEDHMPHVIGGAGLIVLLAYYLLAWARVGRDPETGTIIPLFGPPNGMSAASIRYVRQMKFDDRCFSAAVVELGVNGYLKLNGDSADTVIERRSGSKPIPQPERMAWQSLLGSRSSIKLSQTNHEIISGAINTLKEGLVAAYYNKLFHNNSAWSIVGLLATIALTAAVAISTMVVYGEHNGTFMVVGTLFAMASAAMCAGIVSSWIQSGTMGIGSVVAAVLAAGFVGFGIFMFVMASPAWVDALVALPLLVAAGAATLAFYILKAPTREGRKVMDEIEGFRQYLGIAEEERLQFLHPPEKTPQLFEKFLPHAIALDVENAWAQRFTAVLAAAAAAGVAAGTTANWYSGSGGDFANNPVGFADRLGSDLSSTISSSSAAPGSSGSGGGGSSGGGSSGGGGGGGGGSGW
jgi:uncharacterized membrane protein YgcG